MDKIRWGIMGLGDIAHKFCDNLWQVPDADITACGSRTMEKAADFAKKHNIKNAFATYEELVKCDDVDIIYIATPHGRHYEDAMLCLENGKHVLCEKAFMMNADEAKKVSEFARSKKLFLMEAMWARFFPSNQQALKWYNEGQIGHLNIIELTFGFNTEYRPEHRFFKKELGGGALLDIGAYSIGVNTMYTYGKKPVKIGAVSHIGESQTDEMTGMCLYYGDGQMSMITACIRTSVNTRIMLYGTKGQIEITNFWSGKEATLKVFGKPDELFRLEQTKNGYILEVEEVHKCLRTGKLNSEIMPIEHSIYAMETMDAVRKEIGLSYHNDIR